jgi:hypothetical protein
MQSENFFISDLKKKNPSKPKIFIFKMINTKDCTAIMLETMNTMIQQVAE